MRRLIYLVVGAGAVLYEAAVVAARLLAAVSLTVGAILLGLPVLAATPILALMLIRLRRKLRSLEASKPKLGPLDKQLTALTEQYAETLAAATATINDVRRLLRQRRVVVLDAHARWVDEGHPVGSQP